MEDPFNQAGRVFLRLFLDNHVMMVQRMIGSKMGLGGTSGYHYLKSTIRLVSNHALVCFFKVNYPPLTNGLLLLKRGTIITKNVTKRNSRKLFGDEQVVFFFIPLVLLEHLPK